MSEPAWDRDNVRLLFEVLFDMKVLLSQIVDFFGGGEDDGEEEEEADES